MTRWRRSVLVASEAEGLGAAEFGRPRTNPDVLDRDGGGEPRLADGAIFNAGGDFADGIIAFEGSWLGGETFVSLDRKAVALIAQQGQQAILLA